MEVTEQQRHGLFTWFEEQMGPERTAVLMELISSAGASELATKHDLRGLEQRVEALDARFEALEAQLDARFDAQDARFDARLEAMRSATLRTAGTWLFASQAAVITAIGVATGAIVALS